MKGHEPIIRARKRGWKPTMITIRYDMPVDLPVWDEDKPLDRLSVGLSPVVYIEKDELPDVRFVTGCLVLFEANESTRNGNRIVDRIIENKPDRLVYATKNDFGEWRRGKWAI